MININKENFSEVVEKASTPVIIDVFATWCGPCQYMLPILEELEKENSGKYTFAKLNVDESRDLAIKYAVASVPTFIFIKNNEVLGKAVGAMSKEAFQDKIDELFA